MNTVSRTSFFK